MRLVSVAGRQVSHSLLAAVSDLDSAELEAALRTAVDAHVLVASRGGTYAFRHALLGEAVYDDLLPGERMRLHAAFVAALGEGRAVGTAAELAQHARRADDRPVAVRASHRGGRGGDGRRRPAEAATHFLDALELVDTAREPLADVDAFALARRCAEALVASGRVPKAVKVLRARLAALPAEGAAVDRGQLLTALAAALLLTDTTDSPREIAAEAVELLPDGPPSCWPGRSSSTPRAWAGGTPTRRGASRSRPSSWPSATTSPASPSSSTRRSPGSTPRAVRARAPGGGPRPSGRGGPG